MPVPEAACLLPYQRQHAYVVPAALVEPKALEAERSDAQNESVAVPAAE